MKKKILEESIECQWCNKSNIVTVEEETIEPAIPAVKERKTTVIKDIQTKLM